MHGIVDCESSSDGPPRGIYVEGDCFLGIFGFEEEELGYDAGGEDFVDGAVEADDAFFEEAGENVRGLVAAALGIFM